MKTCKVTNISIKNLKAVPGNDNMYLYEVPADVNEVYGWLHEYETDKTYTVAEAYAAFIRSCLLFNHEVTYDYEVLNENDTNDERWQHDFYADLADLRDFEKRTLTFSMNIPNEYIVDLSADDIEFADTVEQAIFENLLRNLPLDIQVLV